MNLRDSISGNPTTTLLLACLLIALLAWLRPAPSSAMASRADNIVLYVTTPNSEVAKALARSLLEKKLIACANLVPKVTSMYTWKGKIEEDEEVLMILKSKMELIENVVEHVKANHPYEVPEVIATKIEGGNPSYLDWITENTGPEK